MLEEMDNDCAQTAVCATKNLTVFSIDQILGLNGSSSKSGHSAPAESGPLQSAAPDITSPSTVAWVKG